MDFFKIGDVPTLVKLARLDYVATKRTLNYLKVEDGRFKNLGHMTPLLCLCMEYGNTQFVYGRLGVDSFLSELISYDKVYNELILQYRLEGMYVPKLKFFQYKLRSYILFKHFQREIEIERESIEYAYY